MAIQLPAGFEGYTPAQKINYFNQAGITPAQLIGEGVPTSDINWMLQNGYNAGGLPAGASVGLDVPAGWENYTPAQKISWFNANSVSPSDLRNLGVPQADINYMTSSGYTGRPTLPTAGTTLPTAAEIANTPGMGVGGIGLTGASIPLPEAGTTFMGRATPSGTDSINMSPGANTPAATTLPGYTLPAGWTGFTPAQKISWFNANNVRPSQLTAAGVPAADVNWMINNGYTAGRPFANATQGFAQNFQNYTSIPIGAQFNPNATAFGESPYSQIQTQMQPFTNPYANFESGQAMGGYDPNLYNQDLLTSFVEDRAEQAAADRAAAAAEAALADNSSLGAYNGGLITKVMGPNPPTPDDGTMFVQKGEYIIKRDSVNKYGKGLLDMINEGKIPAKKIKSLLD